MTVGMVGADAAALRALAKQFGAQATQLKTIATTLGGRLNSAPWQGSDAAKFRSEWSGRHHASILQAADRLTEASKELLRNAEEQERASDGAGGSIPSSGGPGPAGPPRPASGPPPGASAEEVRQYWLDQAMREAGIDPAKWDPSKGAEHNREIIEAVYRYYGDLYLANEDMQWAGMANMIGPSFAAGFMDLAMFRELGERVGKLQGLPSPANELGQLANLSAEDLRFYETTFLDMQKQIFNDMAPVHTAYSQGGMSAVQQMYDSGAISQDTFQAFQKIDSGDPTQVAQGNTDLLYREQKVVIQDDYQKMYDHSPTGPLMTYAMTQIGSASIPGAQGYPDFDPLTVTFETPGPREFRLGGWSMDNPLQVQVTTETPFAGGNIANFDDRWALVSQDTLPAYQRLLTEDPQRARELIAAPVGDRIAEYRLSEQVDEIVGQLGDWDVRVEQ